MSIIQEFLEFRRPNRAARVRAKIEKNNKKRKALLKEAIQLTQKAEAIEGVSEHGLTKVPESLNR